MDKNNVPVLEEIVRDKKENLDKFVEFLHGSVDIVEKYLNREIEEYKVRVIYQEVLLLVLTELGVIEFEVSKDAVDKVKDTYVGKNVHIVNEMNEDGSRTVKLSVSELEENEGEK